MINRIDGAGDIQKAFPLQEPEKGKINSAKSNLQSDYSVSFQEETLAAVTYTRSGKIDNDSDITGVTDLRDLVVRLLERQGVTWEAAMAGAPVEIDDETQAEAQALIADDGFWGVDQTSDRIVTFAIASAGRDAGTLDRIKEAVSKGFDQAREALGGTLPEISGKTFDAVMTRLDEWAANA
ncbi:MAG: hypothetical protein RBT11_03790 [Desulfobacterales bacterium]|jgi:hypothetical protein|nr:hypothetical protein [Desulfobacterales bacterium]